MTHKRRKQIGEAALSQVATVRRLFVDVLTPEQLDLIADAAEAMRAQFEREVPAA